MLRAAVLLLLAANALMWAWGRGWLAPLLPPPGASEREPERLRLQLQADSITVLNPRASSNTGAALPAAPASAAAPP